MNILIVGLGSMGKRRVRNLHALGHKNIAGYDVRADRRAEAVEKYGITTYATFEAALSGYRPDAVVISTSPKHHMTYAFQAAEREIPCFIEASVVEGDRILELAERAQKSGIVIAPSCTMRYFPGPKRVKELVRSGAIGRPLNLNYHTGQFLPDWHPWERIEDYYVSDRETGACREIVSFELTWLNDVFGEPRPIACAKSKLSDMNADIDDLYHCVLRFPGDMLASMTIEVLSRPFATRELRLLGSEGTLVMSTDEQCVRYARAGGSDWVRYPLNGGTVELGYIYPEEPYIAEMADFLAAVEERNPQRFPNNLRADFRVLQSLYRLEALSESNP